MDVDDLQLKADEIEYLKNSDRCKACGHLEALHNMHCCEFCKVCNCARGELPDPSLRFPGWNDMTLIRLRRCRASPVSAEGEYNGLSTTSAKELESLGLIPVSREAMETLARASADMDSWFR